MVYKIRNIKIFITVFLVFVLLLLAKYVKSNAQTNLIETILPRHIVKTTAILPLSNKSSSIVKVVFESDSVENVDKIRTDFVKKYDSEALEITTPNISKLLDTYLKAPTNFLSYDTRILLQNKKYDDVYNKGVEELYNPMGFQLASVEDDPYLLSIDFLKSNNLRRGDLSAIDDKFYDYLTLKIKNYEEMSTDSINEKIAELLALQRELSEKISKVYLVGSPIHSYYTSMNASFDINMICLLSCGLICFLTYFYFKRFTLLIPIASSIGIGMLTGYVATKLWFQDFQVVTMVFSTTLIGIGIDYSYHYFFKGKPDETFVKNLSFSFLTTIVPFLLLYLTGIELLKQISVFIVFGLSAIYLLVRFIYPCFDFQEPQKNLNIKSEIFRPLLFFLIILSVIGYMRFGFNDTLTSLYVPSKKLQNAEILYSKISANNNQSIQFVTVNGKDFEQIREKEEAVTDILNKEGINSVSVSRFAPSVKRQKENYQLVHSLYNYNLSNYNEILSPYQLIDLKTQAFSPVIFKVSDYPYFQDLMLDENTSIIVVDSDTIPQIDIEGVTVVNVSGEIGKFMRSYRHALFIVFPIALILVWFILFKFFGRKKSLLMLVPSLSGIVLSVGLTSLIWGELNLFSIISLFLIFGFTIDYSIFRCGEDKYTEDAILMSAITTSFSFFLLAFTQFKLISSMSLILFFGISISYMVGKLILPELGSED